MEIIFLCEGGSRGWGTHTESSDSDFRGIFIRKIESRLKVKCLPTVISNFCEDIENGGINKIAEDKSDLCDYILIELEEFLYRNIDHSKIDFNFPLKEAPALINKFP